MANTNPQNTLLNYLLTQIKTIRDPVLGDITIGMLECSIIDTDIFQRLRRIKQLGTVHLIFPGAEHSRFQHSLGTYHMSKILLENVEKTTIGEFSFGNNEVQNKFFKLIIRLAALLHDLYEFPLSHTLEKEGHIFDKQWKNDVLNLKIFGFESELYDVIWNCFKDYHTNEYQDTSHIDVDRVSKIWACTILVYIYKILAESNEDIDDIREKLFHNIDMWKNMIDEKYVDAGGYVIRNTICADLLDYLARDFYFCGIEKKYDKRFFKSATFTEKNGDIVFAYNLLDKRGEIKQSVLSSLFDVLELRYSLAETVHTHRVKNAFSAMVIEAFNFYYQSLDADTKNNFYFDLMKMGDEELLLKLKEENSISKHILNYYFKHKNYKEYVLWANWEARSDRILSDEALNILRNAIKRMKIEKMLINWINKSLKENEILQYGDLLIYVMPDPMHLWKELETYVIYSKIDNKSKTNPLSELAEKNVLSYMSPTTRVIIKRIEMQRELLMSKYKFLWRISLFTSPKINVDDTAYKDIPNLASVLIQKALQLLGIEILPLEPTTPLVLPPEINNMLHSALEDSRSYRTLDDLLKM